VHSLLAAGLILVLPMDRDTARAVLLLCSLPSGFFGILFGLRYGFESHVAGSTVIASSLATSRPSRLPWSSPRDGEGDARPRHRHQGVLTDLDRTKTVRRHTYRHRWMILA
jgi:hypothetical protein